MESETHKMEAPRKSRFWILVGLCVFAGLLWAANWYFVVDHFHDDTKQGQFGDMFGAVNALFTALAFAGLIYTVLLQSDQLALQQEEIIESGKTQEKLVQRQIDAQDTLFERQKTFQKEQRDLQIQHDLKMEQTRQDFEDIIEKRRKDREQERENSFKQNVLRSIRCELQGLTEIYDQGIGAQLAKVAEGETFHLRLALTEDWFTVFTANANHLGRLDAYISRRVVSIYLLLKKLVEEYRINNDYLTRLENIELRLQLEGNSVYFLTAKKQLLGFMQFQAANIKSFDKILKSTVVEFFTLLDQQGIK